MCQTSIPSFSRGESIPQRRRQHPTVHSVATYRHVTKTATRLGQIEKQMCSERGFA
jgi:hypothetical protein